MKRLDFTDSHKYNLKFEFSDIGGYIIRCIFFDKLKKFDAPTFLERIKGYIDA